LHAGAIEIAPPGAKRVSNSSPSKAVLRPRRLGAAPFAWLDRAEFPYVLSLVVGVVAWELVARELPGVVFASPSAVLQRLIADTLSLQLPTALLRSLGHMLLGYTLALAVAIPLGFLMGRNEAAFQMFDPVVNAFFAIPTVAFVPFLMIWFGLFFEGRTALVFIMCVFDVLVTVAAGARNIEPAVIQVARSFGARGWGMATKVFLPASLPFLFTALRIGMARALNAMITAELFFATVNLGKYMQDSAARFDSAGILAVIVLLCALGLGTQEGLKWLETRLLPWHARN
jgi:NitT/TauT family transport system permease protein